MLYAGRLPSNPASGFELDASDRVFGYAPHSLAARCIRHRAVATSLFIRGILNRVPSGRDERSCLLPSHGCHDGGDPLSILGSSSEKVLAEPNI